MPTAQKPTWTACKDKSGLYQGLLIQFSNQTEIIRVAAVQNSLRNGKEIRPGQLGMLEERHFKNGHFEKASFIYTTDTILGRVMPKPTTAKDWLVFNEISDVSVLKRWTNREPEITLDFENGRLVRQRFEKTDYKFKVLDDGRIVPTNHPELKKYKKMFFTDTEPLWFLNAADMKKAMMPGFGSCNQYSGPIGRYTRHYDHFLFKREASETKQLEQLRTIRERFINFCIPTDIVEHLGRAECPPLLPSTRPPKFCAIAISDRMHIPYEPKYFKNEFTFGLMPEEFLKLLVEGGILKFASDYEKRWDVITLPGGVPIVLKKTGRGMLYQAAKKDKKGKYVIKEPSENEKAWWDWIAVPGFSSY